MGVATEHFLAVQQSGPVSYTHLRQEWAKSHIAIFHTPWIIPNQQLSKAGLEANTYTVSVIGECLKDVDLAICGDIHKPLGKFVVEHEFGSTMMVVPGSLTNSSVDRKDVYKRQMV